MTNWIRGTRDGSPGAVPRGQGLGTSAIAPYQNGLHEAGFQVIDPCWQRCRMPLQLLHRIGTYVPSGLQTWITYQTHQPHQTAQGRPENPPAFFWPFV